MDCWLKSGSSKLKESSNFTSIQQTENNEINDGEPPSILKEPVKKKAKKTRKYDKEYLKFGFSWTGDEKEPIPLCIICFENLTNESMKPSNDLNQSEKVKWGLTGGDNQKILEASYCMSLLIVKYSATETIGETLIKSAVKIMAEVMKGDRAKQTFDRVPLSNNTVHRQIIGMSNNVKQIYEKDQEIHDNFLFCQPLSDHTTGEDIFNVMNKSMQENKTDWNRWSKKYGRN
ncbi:zinc finger BED domain-containing protein 5-like [Centruroides sculpturatus]|uniref:zinc finger BED domain-containing protein 5-like n=1 Tax=Centruroides sculpturatus TaxID=218467 RepID=UPI000C6CE59E|nr:zinc finger BED domain-containing protein 5-like [Centruroides sculpturatus]